MLSRVGENLELEDKVKVDMQSFVLSKLYSDSGDVTCGQARASKWQKIKRENTICLRYVYTIHMNRKPHVACNFNYLCENE